MTDIVELASADYQRVLYNTHQMLKGWGGGGKYHADEIARRMRKLGAKSCLDYGCGRGTLKTHPLMACFDVREYDPGLLEKRALPVPADVVVCTDVLEHVEQPLVDNVLQHIHSLTKKMAFFVISLAPANAILHDGRNAHLSVHDADWWIAAVMRARFAIQSTAKPKGLHLWLKPTT